MLIRRTQPGEGEEEGGRQISAPSIDIACPELSELHISPQKRLGNRVAHSTRSGPAKKGEREKKKQTNKAKRSPRHEGQKREEAPPKHTRRSKTTTYNNKKRSSGCRNNNPSLLSILNFLLAPLHALIDPGTVGKIKRGKKRRLHKRTHQKKKGRKMGSQTIVGWFARVVTTNVLRTNSLVCTAPS